MDDPTATPAAPAPQTCKEDGCERPMKHPAAGLCSACYMRKLRASKPKPPKPQRACLICGADISNLRSHARVCWNPKCKAAAKNLPRMWVRVEDKQCTIIENGERCPNEGRVNVDNDRLCNTHKQRLDVHGSVYTVTVVRRPMGEVQSILRHAATLDADADCHLELNPSGGRLSVSYQSKPMTAAKAVYMIRHDTDPGELHVLHRCHRGDDGCITGGHLYLGDHEQNMRDMVEAGRSCRGERQGRSKLTADDAMDIYRRAWSGNETQVSIAEEYGVHQSLISDIKHGKLWGWLTGH